MYSNTSNNDLYLVKGDNDNWGTPIKFVDTFGQSYPVSSTQAPALASFLGSLHAVIQQGGNLIHLIFNDTTNVWNRTSVITSSFSVPSLTAYNSKLFLAMVNNTGNKLAYSSWEPIDGWKPIQSANGESTWGIPAMFVQANVLYMPFTANNNGRLILNLFYNGLTKTWSRALNPPETSAYGVSAAYGEDLAFVCFQDYNGGGGIFVSAYSDDSWAQHHEDTGQSSADTPSMAVLDGVLNVVFNSHNGNGNILWSQRPLTNYSLESWMSGLDDSSYVSSLSIPGTHDSTAVSGVPTVGCQTMSITEQLNAGIRYLDLRVGLINNALFMFHGPYPINLPTGGLPLTTVIGDIQQWLSAATHQREVVIVQIKEDPDPINSTVSLATAVSRVINRNAGFWNLNTTLPTLGNLRGKIQLMRRYSVNQTAGEQAIGIDVTSWADNSPRFAINTPSGVHFVIQDEYEFDEDLENLVPSKFNDVYNLVEEAIGNTDPMTWYINFASATHKLDVRGLWIGPEDIAVGAWDLLNFAAVSGVNSHLRTTFYYGGIPSGRRYGTILMDFPESPYDDLIARIIGENMI